MTSLKTSIRALASAVDPRKEFSFMKVEQFGEEAISIAQWPTCGVVCGSYPFNPLATSVLALSR